MKPNPSHAELTPIKRASKVNLLLLGFPKPGCDSLELLRAVNDRPVRVEVKISSGVCSAIVQVIGLLVEVIVEHESAQLALVSTKSAPPPQQELGISAVWALCGRWLEAKWIACGDGPLLDP